jgi:hypothetical protein
MKRKGINLRDNLEIQALLRELVMLNDEVESVRVLEYSAYNDAPQTLLRVPRSSRKDLFVKNATRTGWIEKLLSAVLPEDLERDKDAEELANDGIEDEDEVGTNPSIAAWWLIRSLGDRHPDEFIKAANDIGMPIHSQPMDEDQAFAMFRDANIGVRAARIIRKHFLAHYGTSFIASESKIRRLGENALPPTVKQFQYKERCYDYWYHEVDQIIEHNLALQLGSNSTATDWTSMEIVFGGDHGQRAFRSGAKIILRGPSKVVKEFPIGEIEIGKDNSEILDNTLFGPFNEGIDRMTNGATCTGVDPDGTVKILKTVNGVVYAKFSLADKRNENDELLQEIPFRVFMTGDLAFYAICHGKENSTSHWCPWCDLSHANWQDVGHPLGELWDLNKISETAEHVAATADLQRDKGVTTMALIWTIGIDRYICPPLHMVLGTGNTILSDYFGWIDKRDGLEILPQSLLAARAKYTEAVTDVEDFKEEQTVWVQLVGPKLAELRIERNRLVSFLKRATISEEERNAGEEQKVTVTEQIKELVEEKKEIDESLKYVRDAAKTLKKELESEEKEFPMVSRAIRAVIEQDYLKPNGVDRAAHHGGDLTGPSVRNLMSKADVIFGGIKDMLLSKNLGVPDAEIIDRCERTATCLTLFDGLFSSVYKTTEQINLDFEGTLAEARDFAKKAMAAWRSLGLSVTLKGHLVDDHVCWQICLYHGIGDYNEEFVERLHQEGVRTNKRVQTMKDRTKKYLHVARWQEATQNPKVKEIQADVNQKRKRKRPATNEEQVEELQSQLRQRQRVSTRLEAASTCEQHAEPLMSARNHNVSDYRDSRPDNN